jgi:hypothetical protein
MKRLIVTVALALGLVVPAVGQAAPTCSRAAARAAVLRYHLGNAGFIPKPVGQVLCGAFLGRGSHAMVVSLAIPSCGKTAGWVVFRPRRGSWRIVMQRNNGAELTAVGSRIRETQNVLRASDAHCFPTGGTRSRTWHWNGKRFVTTRWKYAPPADPPLFWGADGIACDVNAQRALCSVTTSQQTGSFRAAALTPDGAVTTCDETLSRPGCSDTATPINAPVLPAGTRVSIAPFACAVRAASIECIVTATGHGFAMTKDAVTQM